LWRRPGRYLLGGCVRNDQRANHHHNTQDDPAPAQIHISLPFKHDRRLQMGVDVRRGTGAGDASMIAGNRAGILRALVSIIVQGPPFVKYHVSPPGW
jgi:hypothetical protein